MSSRRLNQCIAAVVGQSHHLSSVSPGNLLGDVGGQVGIGGIG